MQNIFKLFVLGLFLSFIAACVSEPDYPDEPLIEYLKSSKINASEGDSLLFTFSFTDGDGNLGMSDIANATCFSNNCNFTADSSCYKDPFYSCFIIDLRDSCFTFLALPDVEPDGFIKAVSGEIDVVYPFLPCKCMNCPVDSARFQIVVKDRSENYSNATETDLVYIQCF